MKHLSLLLIPLLIQSCGDTSKGERCRSAEEIQMVCQVDYAEEYESFQIPDWVKKQCKNYYPSPGCYYDSASRHHW